MVPFAGFNMPLEYSGVTEEHLAVRSGVGVFDVSHMGEFRVKGANALPLLQRITTNDVSFLSPGKCQYSCFPNGKGGVVDDLIVYQLAQDDYLLVVNASNIDKDWEWIVRHNQGACLENLSDQIAQLAIQGPEATAVLQKLTRADLSGIPSYQFIHSEFAGIPEVMISHTGYTGAGGFELYFSPNDGIRIMEAIMNAGNAHKIRPVGLAARDTLRLEMGYCLYGHELDDSTSPLEAGLGWITRFDKNVDFIDKAFLWEQKIQGIRRKRIGFVLQELGIPRQGYPIENAEGVNIGKVTSGTMSPTLKKGIGMGYVEIAQASIQSEIFIVIRNKKVKAEIVKMPFVNL